MIAGDGVAGYSGDGYPRRMPTSMTRSALRWTRRGPCSFSTRQQCHSPASTCRPTCHHRPNADPSPTPTPTPGSAAKLVVTEPDGSVVAGSAFSLELTVQDSSGNIDPDYYGLMTFQLTNAQGDSLSGEGEFIGGVATFGSVFLEVTGSYTAVVTVWILDHNHAGASR